MRLLHYLEIENFKRFGDKQRIELDHPAVLLAPTIAARPAPFKRWRCGRRRQSTPLVRQRRIFSKGANLLRL
ncbi:MAG: hypothetical protein IPP01_06615 [Saprospiraceae bacterium]|nr:hypothetical protein [Saprospiraceae bacterium]